MPERDLFVVVAVDSMVRPNLRAYGPLPEADAVALATEMNSEQGSTGPGTFHAIPLSSPGALVRDPTTPEG